MSRETPRRVVLRPRFKTELESILARIPQAAAAWKGFTHAVARLPETGMAVPGKPGFYSRPFHTDDGSFLVIYSFDDKKVFCVTLRQIPSGLW